MMLKLPAERIVPHRARSFALPEMKSAANLAPFDAADLARMVETMLRAIETGDFDRHLTALEREVQDASEADHHTPPA